jgi:hypothetical protein
MRPAALLAVPLAALWLALAVGCGSGGRSAGGDAQVGAPETSDEAVADAVAGPDSSEAETGPELLPPRVRFNQPAAGRFLSDCQSTLDVSLLVSSERPVVGLTLNGQAVPLEGLPEAQSSVSPAWGLTLLEAVAMDQAGAVGREHRAVLCGQWQPPEQAVQHAADLFLGAGALEAVASLAANLFDGLDLTALAQGMNPVYDSDLLVVLLQSVQHAPGTVLELTPAEDRLLVHLALLEVEAQVTLGVKGDGGVQPVDGVVRASAVEVSGTLAASLEQGQLAVDLPALDFDFQDLEFEAFETQLLDLYPEYKDLLVGLLEDTLSRVLREQVPPAAAAGLAKLSSPVTFDVLAKPFSASLVPAALEITPAGVHAALDVAFTGLEPDPAYLSPGVLATPGADAWPTGLSGFRLSLKDDLLNALFHEAWRSGLMALVVDQAMVDARKAEVTLVAGFLGGVLDLLPQPLDPEAPIRLEVRPVFPPVASLDLPEAGGVRLGVGDLGLEVWSDDWSWQEPVLSLAITVRLEARLQAGPDGMSTAVSAFEVALDVASDDPRMAAAEAYLEPSLKDVLAGLGPVLGGNLGTLALPSIGGFTLAETSIGTQGANGGTLYFEGKLKPVE